jgi:hypothetical protein
MDGNHAPGAAVDYEHEHRDAEHEHGVHVRCRKTIVLVLSETVLVIGMRPL